ASSPRISPTISRSGRSAPLLRAQGIDWRGTPLGCAERPAYAAAPLELRGRPARPACSLRRSHPLGAPAGRGRALLLAGGVKAPLALSPLRNCRPRWNCAGRRFAAFSRRLGPRCQRRDPRVLTVSPPPVYGGVRGRSLP